MKIKISISLTSVHKFLRKNYRWILGIVLILLLFVNLFIYYQYVYLAVRKHPQPAIQEVTIDQETLQNVLDNLDQREENLNRVKTTPYFSPFID